MCNLEVVQTSNTQMTEENNDYKSQLDMKQNKINDLEKRLKFMMEKYPEMKQKVLA